MNTRMSMRERREKIAELVQNDPRVQACSIEFEAVQTDITDWHARNDALCATKGELTELDELLTYSAFCLEDLKCAKRCAYNRLMDQYPRVWDTTCDDPFFAETQTGATEAGGETEEATTLPETEEMSEVPEPDTTATPIRGRVYRITAYNADQGGCHDVDPATLPDDFLDYLADTAHAAHAAHHDMPVDASQYIPVAVVKSILTKWETHYEEFRDFLAGRGLNPDGAGCAIFAIKEIRDDIDKLSTPAQTTDKEGEQ